MTPADENQPRITSPESLREATEVRSDVLRRDIDSSVGRIQETGESRLKRSHIDPVWKRTKFRESQPFRISAVTLAPEDAEAANALAWVLIETNGAATRAVILSEIAVGTNARADFLDTYAQALAAVGRCAEALVQARLAADQEPEYAATVDEVERTCTPSGP